MANKKFDMDEIHRTIAETELTLGKYRERDAAREESYRQGSLDDKIEMRKGEMKVQESLKEAGSRENAEKIIVDLFARDLRTYTGGHDVLWYSRRYSIELPHERIRQCLDDYDVYTAAGGDLRSEDCFLMAWAYEKLGEEEKSNELIIAGAKKLRSENTREGSV